ncbi:MAG: histidine kinase [Bacteroidia bacterium]|nr:histidine kinase [Bacteroidia bacterium]
MRRWLLGFLVLFCLSASGQSLITKNFTTDDGLPTSQIYCALQDDFGTLWLGTENGLVYYDGKKFKTLSLDDGLPENTVIRLLKDATGRIWVTTLSDSLVYLQERKLHGYDYRIYPPKGENRFEIPRVKGVDQKGRIWIGSVYHSLSGVELVKDSFVGFNPDPVLGSSDKQGTTGYFIQPLQGRGLAHHVIETNHTDSTYKVVELKDYMKLLGPFPSGESSNSRYEFNALKDGRFFGICGTGEYVFFNRDHVLQQGSVNFTDQVYVCQDQTENIWVGSRNGVLMMNESDPNKTEIFFNDEFITGVYQDHEGNHWFTDHNKGLRLAHNINFRLYNFHNRAEEPQIASIKVRNNRLFFSTIDGEVWQVSSSFKATKLSSDDRKPYDFYPFEVLPNNTLILPGGRLVHNETILRKEFPDYLYNRDKTFHLTDRGVHVGNSIGVLELNNDARVVRSSHYRSSDGDPVIPIYKEDGNVRTNAILPDDESVWMGTVRGLYRCQHDSIRAVGHDNPLLRHRITSLSQYGSNKVLIGTKGVGLLIYTPQTGSVYRIEEQHGLASNMVRCTYVRGNKTYIGTNKGLSVVTFGDDHQPLSIVNFDRNNALPSNEVNAIAFHEDRLWIGTGRGMVYVNPETLVPNNAPPPIRITRFKANDSLLDCSTGELRLHKSFRNLTFSFNGVGFRAGSLLEYKYILAGVDSDTVFSGTSEARYTNMPPGKHVFQVWAKNEDGYWSKSPAEAVFEIPKRFTETYTFLALVILMIAGIVTGVWILLYRRKRAKLKTELQTAELKQQALAALMNPHFVYNSLTAIQHFINSENTDKSNLYLSQFAKLVRQNLTSVRKGFISLEDEVERLQLYLNIEKMRFGEKLEFEVNVDENLDMTGVKIPSMIFQPFVENAIWHGILPKPGMGKVVVHFKTIDANILDVVIEDDGMGIAKTLEKGDKQHHTSMSMDITKERLELLGKQSGKTYSIEVLDLGGKEGGTRVHFTIPLILSY